MTTTDLNAANVPEQVARILLAAAEKYHETADELRTAWQDKDAGTIWRHLAAVLTRASERAEKICRQHGFDYQPPQRLT